MKKTILYQMVRPLFFLFSKFILRAEIIGSEHIPSSGPIILSGTHISNLDCVLLMASTKRQIHFLAKKELFDGFFGIFFSHMGLIPVDRSKKDQSVIPKAIEYLSQGEIVGIFPEGTTEKKRGLLPFKIGTVKISYESKIDIVPFVIKGKYRLFSKSLSICFGKPIKIKNKDLEKENQMFRKRIENMLLEDRS